MRSIVVLLLVLFTGCVPPAPTAPGAGPTGAPETIITTASGMTGAIRPATQANVAPTWKVSAEPETVWPVLMRTYIELGIPLTTIDSENFLIGNRRLTVKGEMAGEPPSRFLDCGSTAGVTSIADSYFLNVSVLSELIDADDGGTHVVTYLSGRAENPFTSGGSLSCASTERLEEAIAGRLREEFGPAEPEVSRTPFPPPTGSPVPAAERDSDSQGNVLQRQKPAQTSSLLMGAAGFSGGTIGILLGSQVGKDCTSHCLTARGALWPLVGSTVLVPLSIHLVTGGDGGYLQSAIASSAWALIGAVAAGITDDQRVLWAVPPAQVLTSVWLKQRNW